MCDFSRRLKPYELPNLALRKLTAPRHLSRYTAATMYPRQPDIEARSLADETSAGSLLNLTVNFFSRTSFGTNVLEKYSYIYIRLEFYRQDFLVKPHIPNCLGALLCTKLQQFLARFHVQNYYTTAQHLAT